MSFFGWKPRQRNAARVASDAETVAVTAS
jgi:hypothetical protein